MQKKLPKTQKVPTLNWYLASLATNKLANCTYATSILAIVMNHQIHQKYIFADTIHVTASIYNEQDL